MAETVFILGAGASKQGGAPLMANFLDVAEMLWRRGKTKDADEDFEMVFSTLAKLQAVHSKSELDLTNIESAFAALEMAKTLSRLPGLPEHKIPRAISALKKVIVKTLETTLQFPTNNNNVQPPPPYDIFAELVRHIREEAHPQQRVAVLTFNYDIALDYAWYWKGLMLDYALGETETSIATPVLKLHGSLNWGICARCKEVVPWTLQAFFTSRRWDHALPSTINLDIGARLKQHKHCEIPLSPDPMLVPPTWNKGEYHASLSKVWSKAARELSEAENIFVCGYSLPETDSFFRFLYALGTVGERPLKRFWVCDPDSSGLVQKRFEAMLGPGARRRFEYKQMTFNDAIKAIKREFPNVA